MEYTASYQSYASTGLFSNLVLDYLSGNEKVEPFYCYKPDLDGIKSAIANKCKQVIDRKRLVKVLNKQYEPVNTSEKVRQHIGSLLNENVFTVCTAHQPNIFTGHLYFIYKIIHAIRLSEFLNQNIAGQSFVPVYYMGSEDADINELGEVFVNGVDYMWSTQQKGAVGRMLVDEALIGIVNQIEDQFKDDPFGGQIILKIRAAYTLGKSIQQATFELVNDLFQQFGLIVFLPDNKEMKLLFKSVVEEEITTQFSHKALHHAIDLLSENYKIQTVGREINLFYLKDNIRERIERDADFYKVVNTELSFTENEILEELNHYPDRFSPNVILRPLYQELILPNIAFIGGGGEMAYWLELKSVFETQNLPFPVLVLRNSFSFIESPVNKKIQDLGLEIADVYKSTDQLFLELVKQKSEYTLQLDNAKDDLRRVYEEIKDKVAKIDTTLIKHTDALLTKSLKKINALEKKMLRAEKRKYKELLSQIEEIKAELFPNDILQERVENFLAFYANHGDDFIKVVYENSTPLDFQFCNIAIK